VAKVATAFVGAAAVPAHRHPVRLHPLRVCEERPQHGDRPLVEVQDRVREFGEVFLDAS
jgi:hypothetical protein